MLVDGSNYTSTAASASASASTGSAYEFVLTGTSFNSTTGVLDVDSIAAAHRPKYACLDCDRRLSRYEVEWHFCRPKPTADTAEGEA